MPQAMSVLSGVAPMAVCCAGLASTLVNASQNKKLNGNNCWYRDQPIRVPGTLLQLSDIAPIRKHSRQPRAPFG